MLIDMAKKKKTDGDVKNIEVKATTVKPKKKPKTNTYILKRDVSVGGKPMKKGDKISLTENGMRYFRSKKYI